MRYKPDDANAVSPYLIVEDAAATIEFLTAALGATTLRVFRGEDARVQHAEIRIDDTVLMLSDAAPGWPAVRAHVHVFVPDVDAAYARALAAGATSVQAPVRKGGDEDKRGGVADSGGTTWWIATRVAAAD